MGTRGAAGRAAASPRGLPGGGRLAHRAAASAPHVRPARPGAARAAGLRRRGERSAAQRPLAAGGSGPARTDPRPGSGPAGRTRGAELAVPRGAGVSQPGARASPGAPSSLHPRRRATPRTPSAPGPGPPAAGTAAARSGITGGKPLIKKRPSQPERPARSAPPGEGDGPP